MIASLLMFAIGFGVVFTCIRSLIPGLVAHAIIDVPTTPTWHMLIGLFQHATVC